MIEKRKNKGGAPRGNQNARKHGLYSRALTPEQQKALPGAIVIEGADREIGVIRLKIGSILANDPDNSQALRLATSLLDRLLRTRKLLKATQEKEKANAVSSAAIRHLMRLFPENNLRSIPPALR